MLVHLRRSLVMAVICLVFFGFIYAFAGTGVAQVLFRFQADGSMTKNGSLLIGQNWSSPKWFHGRPDDAGPYAASATQAGGDNPLVANGHDGESAATNLGPHSKVLEANTKALVAYWHKLGVKPTIDLVTTSGSGYDDRRHCADSDGDQGHGNLAGATADAHQAADASRAVGILGLELHRRPAVERRPRETGEVIVVQCRQTSRPSRPIRASRARP